MRSLVSHKRNRTSQPEERSRRSPEQAAIRGAIGGLIATALMTMYRFPLFRALPPTAEFWAMFVRGGQPEQYPIAGLLLHFLYGATAGGVFGVSCNLLTFRTQRDRRIAGIFLSLLYGLVLSVFGSRVLLKRLLDEAVTPDERAVFHVGHVIYGLTLGTWLSSRERAGEVYE